MRYEVIGFTTVDGAAPGETLELADRVRIRQLERSESIRQLPDIEEAETVEDDD